jgi:DNA-binding CsgD family transcriptional regulator
MSAIIHQFFEPVRKPAPDEITDDELMSPMAEVLTTLSKISSQSTYIIDYTRKEFQYVSPHPLFLCGYSAMQVQNMGYHYYEKMVPPEDLQMLLEINKCGFEFFYNLPIELRHSCSICYNFRLKHLNGDVILVNHQLTPLTISKSGNLLRALCVVIPAHYDQAGMASIRVASTPLVYVYLPQKKKFVAGSFQMLSDREKQTLSLGLRGLKATEIASKLNISPSTVKYHKQNIYKKLNVNNMHEASYLATVNQLL